MAKKNFPIEELLSITTGKMLCKSQMLGVRSVMSFLTEDSFLTDSAAYLLHAPCAAIILQQHPQLAKVPHEGVCNNNHAEWLRNTVATYGEFLELERPDKIVNN